MKSFKELKNEITLVRYIGSKFGTMYFEPNVPREEESIIRHLDGDLPIDLLPVYEELYSAIIKLIEVKSSQKLRNMCLCQNYWKLVRTTLSVVFMFMTFRFVITWIKKMKIM